MAQPADLFGAGVTDDPARRNTRPELSCLTGNLAPVRPKQMKRPCRCIDFDALFCCAGKETG